MLQEQTTEGIPVKMLRVVPFLLAVLTLFSAGSALAQSRSAVAEGCAWSCHDVDLPLGLAVAQVADGGSFVTLEDGSVWEVRLPQRPVAASWQPGTFVEVRNVLAPVDRFEILLAHGDNDRVEARLSGRRPAGTAGQQ